MVLGAGAGGGASSGGDDAELVIDNVAIALGRAGDEEIVSELGGLNDARRCANWLCRANTEFNEGRWAQE